METDMDNFQDTYKAENGSTESQKLTAAFFLDFIGEKSENKRVESVNQKIRTYYQQKSVIKAALSSVDSKFINRVAFDERSLPPNDSNSIDSHNYQKRKILFDDEEDDDDDFSFPMKKQFDGAEGQKLFALQSSYKNDTRFKLDKKFLNDEEEIKENDKNDDMSVEQEKMYQIKLLEEVLGNKVHLKKGGESVNRTMLRFDPTQSDHLKYEMVYQEKTKREKKSKKTQDVENMEIDQPQVSKDVYYKVNENLMQVLQEKESFSLLNLFNKSEKIHTSDETEQHENKIVEKNKPQSTISLSQYDSSDEGENTSLPEKQILNPESHPLSLWTEPFFFTEDDFRLQEGFDFLKRIAAAPENDFSQLRRDLKSIVKSKFRNNQRKGQPFKKKLGGNKRKKLIRIKKALKN